MSDVRIERVEACEHGYYTPHDLSPDAADSNWCSVSVPTVLSGFPPEAVGPAIEAYRAAIVEHPDSVRNIVEVQQIAIEAALAAAWAVLVGGSE